MSDATEARGMGWLPDYPDFRDYTVEQDQIGARLKELGQKDSVKTMLRRIGVAETEDAARPHSVDLRQHCSPVEDQGQIGSCTAQAGVGMVEYFERRAFGKHTDASRMFLYKVTRNMLHWTGDTGAFLRSAMGALTLFGVPPEEYWPYNPASLDTEPPAFCYAFAQSYQAISFYRLDPPATSPADLLKRIKANLAASLPSMFGFSVYAGISQAKTGGKIPFPTSGEKILGGHAVMVVGYDNATKIVNSNPGGKETTGALLVRNSWGAGWGVGGYGWLPYEYVLSGLAVDWWSLLKNEWVDTGVFKI